MRLVLLSLTALVISFSDARGGVPTSWVATHPNMTTLPVVPKYKNIQRRFCAGIVDGKPVSASLKPWPFRPFELQFPEWERTLQEIRKAMEQRGFSQDVEAQNELRRQRKVVLDKAYLALVATLRSMEIPQPETTATALLLPQKSTFERLSRFFVELSTEQRGLFAMKEVEHLQELLERFQRAYRFPIGKRGEWSPTARASSKGPQSEWVRIANVFLTGVVKGKPVSASLRPWPLRAFEVELPAWERTLELMRKSRQRWRFARDVEAQNELKRQRKVVLDRAYLALAATLGSMGIPRPEITATALLLSNTRNEVERLSRYFANLSDQERGLFAMKELERLEKLVDRFRRAYDLPPWARIASGFLQVGQGKEDSRISVNIDREPGTRNEEIVIYRGDKAGKSHPVVAWLELGSHKIRVAMIGGNPLILDQREDGSLRLHSTYRRAQRSALAKASGHGSYPIVLPGDAGALRVIATDEGDLSAVYWEHRDEVTHQDEVTRLRLPSIMDEVYWLYVPTNPENGRGRRHDRTPADLKALWQPPKLVTPDRVPLIVSH